MVSAVLAKIKALAAAADPSAELRVVLVPTACDVLVVAGGRAAPGVCTDPPPIDRRHLAAICRDRGIPLLDLTDAFASAWRARPDGGARGEPYYFPYDGHWTLIGHRVAAEKIYAAWGTPGARAVQPR